MDVRYVASVPSAQPCFHFSIQKIVLFLLNEVKNCIIRQKGRFFFDLLNEKDILVLTKPIFY